MRVKVLIGFAATLFIGAGTAMAASASGRASLSDGAADAIKATFTEVKGEVKISTAPASRWHVAEKGMRCGPGATIKTGPRGYAQLLFDDESALRLEKNTKLTLRQAEREKGVRAFLVEMFNGRLLSNIPKSNKFGKTKFQVKTPGCSAAVRGTQFVTESSTSGASVAVYEGSVVAENPSAKGEVEVSANQQTEVAGDRPPTAPHALSAEMENYRKDVAALFAQYSEGLRANMEAVQQMNALYMEKHRQEMQEGMDEFNDSFQGVMEEFRDNMGTEGQ